MRKFIFAIFIPIFIYAEGISFSGRLNLDFISRPQRRDTVNPSNTFRAGISGGLNFYGISAGLSLFFNSDDKFTPNATSFYSLTPTWSWGRLYIGDFAPGFSSLTLSGISIRGGGLELFPGIFNLFVVSGEAKLQTDDSTTYSRYIWGAKLGLGKNTGTSITVINSKDISATLPDSMKGSPHSNWVGEVEQKLSMFKGAFSLKLSGALSLITRNVNATPVDNEKLPDWAVESFKINSSSSVDYSYGVESRLRLRKIALNFSHFYIGPGYESYGLSGINNDKIEDRGGFNLSFGRYGSMGANFSLSKDNLINLKEESTTSRLVNAFVSLIPSPKLVLMASGMVSMIEREGDSISTDTKSQSVNSGVNFRLTKKLTAGLNVSYAKTDVDVSVDSVSSRVMNYGVKLNHRIGRVVSYSIGMSYMITSSDTLSANFLSPSANFQVAGKRIKANLGIRAGISDVRNMIGINFRTVFKITPHDALIFRVNSENFSDTTPSSLTLKASYSRSWKK